MKKSNNSSGVYHYGNSKHADIYQRSIKKYHEPWSSVKFHTTLDGISFHDALLVEVYGAHLAFFSDSSRAS